MNRLYFGNNLPVLSHHVQDEAVDLVYLDPPFNSKAEYNVLYETPANQRDTAQRSVFHDSWHWEDEARACFEYVLARGGPPASILNALYGALGRSDTMAYLAMMSARLIEIRRVMKPTASLYLHCDPTASHYLKVVMDAIFGPTNFKSEIIWKRSSSHNRAKRWGPVHDTILFYTASKHYTWNRTYTAYDESYLSSKYRHSDNRGRYRLSDLTGPGRRTGDSGLPWHDVDPGSYGRHWEPPHDRALPPWFEFPLGWSAMTPRERLEIMSEQGLIRWPQKEGGRPEFKRYLVSARGQPVQDVITDIDPVNPMARERVGYPTQKPVALLRRIIEASSNPGDVILDPFCGCGTSVHAAAEMGREWIGIDVSYYGIRLIERRVRSNFGPTYPLEISGIPADLSSAEALAESAPYGFQQWAVDELGCQMWNDGKKGADGGIDGEMWFFAGPGAPGRLLVQVKAGKKTTVAPVREFARVLERERAQMGVFVTRSNPTAEMRQEAGDAGVFRIGSATYPRLQLVSMESWFAGHRPQLPTPIPLQIPQDRSRPKPKAAKRPNPQQPQLPLVFTGDLAAAPEGQVINPSLLPAQALRSGVA